MEATLQLPGLEASWPLEPFRGACPVCSAIVLAVELDGREVALEVGEVMPEHDCPNCRQVRERGHRRSGCVRCDDSGRLGESLPLRGVAVSASGEARAYRAGDVLAEGEAVHVFHSCAHPV